MSAPGLCRLIQFVALLGLLAGAAAMGLLGVPETTVARDTLGALSALLLLGGLGLLRRLARRCRVQLPEFSYALLESVIAGLVFLAVVYHFSGVLPFFAPVQVALDRLMPGWAGHALGLAPGAALIVAAEGILRRPRPASPAPEGTPPSPRNSKEAKNGKL